MANYPYEMQLVVDPDNPRNVVPGGSVSIYDSADTGRTTLLTLTDPTGVPIANPITSNANGFTPPFVTTSPQVLWVSGEYTDYFNSFIGMRNEAVAAVAAAEAAASTAGASAAAAVDAALSGAVTDAQSAATAAAASSTAAANSAALVGAPADSAVQTLVNASGSATRAAIKTTVAGEVADTASATRAALNATFVPKWKPTTAYLAGDKVLSPGGDVVSAKVDFTSGASYSSANWDISTTYTTPTQAAGLSAALSIVFGG